ncbi:MAG: cell wall metabolism sensor histidine kinase WalK [Lachnospiraceae bacterium]|nr:cell wall metabolism sensor histidine kinase WalK [Lachnospiraceae bacterium]
MAKLKKIGSIRTKLTVTLIIVLVLWVLASQLFNRLFLQKYYMWQVEGILMDSYNRINEMLDDSEEIYDILSKNFYTNSNIEVVIGQFIDENTVVPDYSTSNDGYLGFASMEMLFSLAANVTASEPNTNEWVYKKSGDTEEGSYVIQKTHDNRTQSDYLDLVGKLNNGHVIVIQTPLESIKNSADICNTFNLYVGLGFILLGSIVMFIVSNRYAKPITEMADIAERMSELDFDAKVTKFSKDEVGVLGVSMNNLSNKLESTISELKTANNELMKDIEHKEEVDEMRKEFVSNVSHELKTPIALIQGYAEGLKDNVLDDEESKEFYCDVIIDEAGRMNKMVKNLLILTELEHGDNLLSIERFDLYELVNNIVMMSDIMIQKLGADVIIDVEPNTYCWADEFRIEGVLTNYFNNALNHLSGDKKVRVYTEPRNNDIRVYVENSGDPIPEEDIDKLFIKFYKVDKARSRDYGGNGIGLSIVAATMKAHNKDYGVENLENGVRFYFDLDTVND